MVLSISLDPLLNLLPSSTIGGLEYFGRYIAEDYFLSEALYHAGNRPVLVGSAMQRVGPRTVYDIYQRQLRSGSSPATYLYYSRYNFPICNASLFIYILLNHPGGCVCGVA